MTALSCVHVLTQIEQMYCVLLTFHVSVKNWQNNTSVYNNVPITYHNIVSQMHCVCQVYDYCCFRFHSVAALCNYNYISHSVKVHP